MKHLHDNADTGPWTSCNWWEFLFSWVEADWMVLNSWNTPLKCGKPCYNSTTPTCTLLELTPGWWSFSPGHGAHHSAFGHVQGHALWGRWRAASFLTGRMLHGLWERRLQPAGLMVVHFSLAGREGQEYKRVTGDRQRAQQEVRQQNISGI